MKINYTARHTEITPDIKKYCERRLKSIEKKLGEELEADIILSTEKYRDIAEINIKSRLMPLFAEEETTDMMNSLNAAFNQLNRRARKEKEKIRRRKRRPAETPEPAFDAAEERGPRIISSGDFSLKPMTVEEALLQLDSGRREVFVFRRSDSQQWAVVYKRRDGHFGLVEPR